MVYNICVAHNLCIIYLIFYFPTTESFVRHYHNVIAHRISRKSYYESNNPTNMTSESPIKCWRRFHPMVTFIVVAYWICRFENGSKPKTNSIVNNLPPRQWRWWKFVLRRTSLAKKTRVERVYSAFYENLV